MVGSRAPKDLVEGIVLLLLAASVPVLVKECLCLGVMVAFLVRIQPVVVVVRGQRHRRWDLGFCSKPFKLIVDMVQVWAGLVCWRLDIDNVICCPLNASGSTRDWGWWINLYTGRRGQVWKVGMKWRCRRRSLCVVGAVGRRDGLCAGHVENRGWATLLLGTGWGAVQPVGRLTWG